MWSIGPLKRNEISLVDIKQPKYNINELVLIKALIGKK
jgi:hypothetical protein